MRDDSSDGRAERGVAGTAWPPRLSRRDLLKAGLVAAAAAAGPAACAPGGSRPPNLLFVFTDDQNADLMGYASGGRVITPNLDALAAAGAIFDAAYCNAIPCTPSRGCVLTGLYFDRWKRLSARKNDRLVPGEWTYAHALRAAGYHTGLIGKMHLKPFRSYHGFEHAEYSEHMFSRAVVIGQPIEDDYEKWLAQFGLEDWQNTRRLEKLSPEDREAALRHGRNSAWPYDEKYHPISWIRDRSIAYLDARRQEQRPFCLTVSIRYPHAPRNPAQRFLDMYDPDEIEVPTDEWDDMVNMPEAVRRIGGQLHGQLPRDRHSVASLQRRLAQYRAIVTQIDAAVGSIVEHVDLSDTLVFFSSDHGDYMGRRGCLGKQPMMHFEPIARVPFFACGPGVPAGVTVENPIGLVDLAPTFLEAAGLEVPADLDGVPLQRYFEDPRYGADRSVQSGGMGPGRMIRRGRFKYFRLHQSDAELLFDLSRDPDEMRNLAGLPELEPVRRELAAAMNRSLRKPPHRLPRFEAPSTG